VAQNGTKRHKKMAQSRPSFFLCHFYMNRVSLFYPYCAMKFRVFQPKFDKKPVKNRKNHEKFSELGINHSNITKKCGLKNKPVSYQKWHNLEDRLFCATIFRRMK
jgi:hypothetical protein